MNQSPDTSAADEQARKRSRALRKRFKVLRRIRFRQPPIIRMIGYDAMPPPLRAAMRTAGVNFSPFEVARLMQRGIPLHQIISTMVKVGGDTPERRVSRSAADSATPPRALSESTLLIAPGDSAELPTPRSR